MKLVAFWEGRPITDLTKEELLEVVEYLSRELERQRTIPKDYRKMVMEKL